MNKVQLMQQIFKDKFPTIKVLAIHTEKSYADVNPRGDGVAIRVEVDLGVSKDGLTEDDIVKKAAIIARLYEVILTEFGGGFFLDFV